MLLVIRVPYASPQIIPYHPRQQPFGTHGSRGYDSRELPSCMSQSEHKPVFDTDYVKSSFQTISS